MGKVILTVMLAFGTLERDVLIERTRAGLDAARAQGHVGGRPTVVSAHKLSAARCLIQGGATVTAAAAAVSASRSSLYRGWPGRSSPCTKLARTDATFPSVWLPLHPDERQVDVPGTMYSDETHTGPSHLHGWLGP